MYLEFFDQVTGGVFGKSAGSMKFHPKCDI